MGVCTYSVIDKLYFAFSMIPFVILVQFWQLRGLNRRLTHSFSHKNIFGAWLDLAQYREAHTDCVASIMKLNSHVISSLFYSLFVVNLPINTYVLPMMAHFDSNLGIDAIALMFVLLGQIGLTLVLCLLMILLTNEIHKSGPELCALQLKTIILNRNKSAFYARQKLKLANFIVLVHTDVRVHFRMGPEMKISSRFLLEVCT